MIAVWPAIGPRIWLGAETRSYRDLPVASYQLLPVVKPSSERWPTCRFLTRAHPPFNSVWRSDSGSCRFPRSLYVPLMWRNQVSPGLSGRTAGGAE